MNKLPWELQPAIPKVTQAHKIAKYVNSLPRLNSHLSHAIMLEEERLKPALVSIGERAMLCDNDRFNTLLIKYLLKSEKIRKSKLNRNM